jgi:hypothetical protein
MEGASPTPSTIALPFSSTTGSQDGQTSHRKRLRPSEFRGPGRILISGDQGRLSITSTNNFAN